MRTIVVAVIIETWDEMYPPSIYQVDHDPGVDPVEAIKAAAQEFVATPEGQEYLKTDVGSDAFNWGDAVVAIPLGTLARYGVYALEVQDLGNCVVVNHDECIAD